MKEMRDNCGVVGIYSKQSCANDIYFGIDFLQHRGQEYCGIATVNNKEISMITHRGRVGGRFTELELKSLAGNFGIGHVSLKDRQPLKLQTQLGTFAGCFSVSTDSHIELILKLIGEGKNIIDGISKMSTKIIGSFSLLVLNKNGIYVVRDSCGFRPLILGKGKDSFIVASESRAIESLDMEIERDVKPGEIVLIDKKGFRTLKELKSHRVAHCAFEWAYIASIDSKIDGVYVKEARNNLGEKLAQRDEKEGGVEADCVSPVPMSGIGHALGYHKRSKIQYQDVFLYNRYADRSYTMATQDARDRMAKRKLSVIREAVEGKRIILCDDSIVRGTQIRNKVRDLKKAGAKAVHVRIACPPLMHPCIYGISTRTYEELAARSYIKQGEIDSLDKLRMVEGKVAEQIGADSVKYNSLEDFVTAIGLPKDELCLRCWDGVSCIEEKS
jgi:amidophosphoribosyltransferase